MRTKVRKYELVSQVKADRNFFKTDIPNDFCILSFPTHQPVAAGFMRICRNADGRSVIYDAIKRNRSDQKMKP